MTKKVKVGNTEIGGGSPVTIQSMTNCDTRDSAALSAQIRELYSAGCEIVRAAVADFEAAESFGRVKKSLRAEGIEIPLVADIHFDHRLAIEAIKQGADKIRINPGNIGGREKIREVAAAARAQGIAIRVGVNAGSLEADILKKYGGITAEALSESALRNAEILEDAGFSDMVLSLKASAVPLCVEAYRLVSAETDYPLHVGITEAGDERQGLIKSAAGIGALILSGIGDTVRVSLTGNPVREVIAGREILEACGLRRPALEIISCPTCGRTQVDLEALVNEARERLTPLALSRKSEGRKGLRIAIMGCVVNGPGEAGNADFGVACGKGKAALFVRGKVEKTIDESEIISVLSELAEKF